MDIMTIDDVMSRCTYSIVLQYIVGILPSRALYPGKITSMKDLKKNTADIWDKIIIKYVTDLSEVYSEG